MYVFKGDKKKTKTKTKKKIYARKNESKQKPILILAR
jgi:hypothetical protein